MSAAPTAVRGVPRRPLAGVDARFVLLCAAVGTDALGLGMIYPLLARIQHANHLPTYSLGFISGAAFFGSLAGQAGVSHLLDGERARRVLLGGLAVAVAALAWFGLAGDLWQLAASRGIYGVAFGAVSPAALRACTVGVAAQERGARLGRLSSVQMGGIVLGPLAGIGLAAAGGLRAPFLAAAAALAVVLAGLVVTTAPVPGEGLGGVARAERGPLPALRPVAAVLLVAVAAQLPVGLYDALWSRLLTDRGASSLLIGLGLTVFGVPVMVLAPYGGRLAARVGNIKAATASLVLIAGFVASYGFIRSPIVITLLGVGEACLQAVAIPAGFAAVADVFPDTWAATGQGWFSGAGTVGAGLTALAGAPLYAAWGPGAVFGIGAILSAATALAAGIGGGLGTGARYRRD